MKAKAVAEHDQPTINVEPSAELVTITPAMARTWLEKNVAHNHGVRPSVVEAYARDILAGQWHISGDPIRFDEEGNLLDGQHRLLAIIKADRPIKSFVVRDISKDAFWVLDSGIKRTLGDEFTFVGERNAIALAAGIHQLMRYERGIFDKGTSLKATRHEYKEALERHPDIRDSVRYGQATKDIMRHSIGTALHYLFAQKDKVLADDFFIKLSQGTNLKDDDPIYLLRERFLRENVKGGKTRMVPREVAALVIKAWNAKRKDEKPRSLRWRGEMTREPCPAYPLPSLSPGIHPYLSLAFHPYSNSPLRRARLHFTGSQ